jgi:hypothetical protein
LSLPSEHNSCCRQRSHVTNSIQTSGPSANAPRCISALGLLCIPLSAHVTKYMHYWQESQCHGMFYIFLY